MTKKPRDDPFAKARQRMTSLIRRRGVEDETVLAAMDKVPRERFVPEHLAEVAYEDGPLPIGEGQTISQPYIVALMIEAARIPAHGRVLEIGTGSGYSAAVMAEMGLKVFTIERHEALADAARRRLAATGYGSVEVCADDGTLGWPEAAPFDAIIVTAAGPHVPHRLAGQLRPGARMIIPIGRTAARQNLMRVTRKEDGAFEEENLGAVAFVPLIGSCGWPE